uniref:Ankyrin repeat domain 10a n=1 Tax=Oncorhynchus mykiss TaxID=8022 RepID=A0A8K9XN67_ONCMY
TSVPSHLPNFGPISPCSLRNANGLTAADLAHAQGFWECAQLLSNAQNQLNGELSHRSLSQSRGFLNGLANRKRLLDSVKANHIKKARTDETCSNVVVWVREGFGRRGLYLNGAISTNGHMPTHLKGANTAVLSTNFSSPWGLLAVATSTENGLSSSRPTYQEAEETRRRSAHEMCGSLHLTGSPSSCVSHRPSWKAMASDPGDTLHYGHYHGVGDTAEEHSSLVHVEQLYDQAVLSAIPRPSLKIRICS